MGVSASVKLLRKCQPGTVTQLLQRGGEAEDLGRVSCHLPSGSFASLVGIFSKVLDFILAEIATFLECFKWLSFWLVGGNK